MNQKAYYGEFGGQYVAFGEVDGVKYSIWLEEDESIKAKMKVVKI